MMETLRITKCICMCPYWHPYLFYCPNIDIIYFIQYLCAFKWAFQTDTSYDSKFCMFCACFVSFLSVCIFLPLWLVVNPTEIQDLWRIICQTRAETKCWFQRVKLFPFEGCVYLEPKLWHWGFRGEWTGQGLSVCLSVCVCVSLVLSHFVCVCVCLSNPVVLNWLQPSAFLPRRSEELRDGAVTSWWRFD